jgi:Do/DeqQ family serine protease
MSSVQYRKITVFILRSAVAGLAIAFIVLYLFPDLHRTESGPQLQATYPAPVSATGNGTSSYSKAVASSAPSVVNIYITKLMTARVNPLLQDPIFRRFFGVQRMEQQFSPGSGVILNPDGYIVTNAHVVEGADEILVTLIDGRQTKAAVIGTDPETDLALLQIQLDALPAIQIGDSDALNVGDVVLAIGNPYDVGQTVTQGIVSAKGRKRQGLSPFEDFIQTDADINPGNSGGALINSRGELVGINTSLVTSTGGSQGIGLAIPIKLAFDVINQLLDHGHVIRGYLGVTAIPLPRDTQDISGQQLTGILVETVNPGGPADNAGIIPGDIITEVNGRQILDTRQAFRIISDMQPGTVAEIAVLRGWEAMRFKATIIDKPAVTMR